MEDRQQVRVMTEEEKDSYQGLTIDENFGDDKAYSAQHSARGNFNSGVHSFTFDLLRSKGWWWKALLVLGLVGAAILFVGFILPLLLILAGVGIAVWLVLQLIS